MTLGWRPMFSSGAKVICSIIVALACAGGKSLTTASTQQASRRFTVADEIGLTLFGDGEQAVRLSPDDSYAVVYTERGRLDVNGVEDSLRFYRSAGIEHFLEHPDESQPSPVWALNLS